MADEKKTIEEYKKEAEEYLNGWKRAKADLVNLQKQTERERAEWFMYASGGCVKAILPVVDALQNAVAQFTVNSSQFTDGVKGIYDQMAEALKSMGVEAIDVAKEPPNPELHEVVGTEKAMSGGPSSDTSEDGPPRIAPGLIMKEVQRGYTLHGKVLRAAKVIVAE